MRTTLYKGALFAVGATLSVIASIALVVLILYSQGAQPVSWQEVATVTVVATVLIFIIVVILAVEPRRTRLDSGQAGLTSDTHSPAEE